MRQFMVAIVLVASAFAGGAIVNGPGLQWVQAKILRSLGLQNGGEISSVDLKPVANSGADSSESGFIKPDREAPSGPVAPTPTLVTGQPPSKTSDFERSAGSLDVDPPSASSATKSKAVAGATLPGEADAARSSPPLQPPTSDPDVKPARASTNIDPPSSGAPALLDTLAGLLPTGPASGRQPEPSSSRADAGSGLKSTSTLDGNQDWAVLERKMQSAGISRYTVEGVPGGRVVFSCLIPIAGRQAVTQRFEAEGDDLVQATQATLRRITLWQATQPGN